MLLRLGKVAIALSLFCLVDGHLGSLQCVAWINMISERSAEADSLPQLLVETVSGDKPCELCRSIQEHHRDDDRPTNAQVLAEPLKLIPFPADPVILTPPAPRPRRPDPGSFGRSRAHPPLEKPPATLA